MAPLAPLVALLLSATPRVFLSVDRTFLPGAPGSVVHVELEGAQGLDVRLYQLRDPARLLGAMDEPSGAASPAQAPRSPSAPALLARGAANARQGLHAEVEPLLTPAALDAARLLAPGTVLGPSREYPFLRGETLLRRWTLPCGGDEAHHFCDVDLGPLPAGVYLVEGVAGGAVGQALALVSRLALVGRHTAGQVLLFAADAKTGEPRAGIQVSFESPGQPPLRGTTNALGTLALRPLARSGKVVAHAGNDWAALELQAVAPRARGPRLLIAPSAGEVRPGERVRFWGVERPPPAAPRELPVSLEDGRGSRVAMGVVQQDALGMFMGALDLPDLAAPGLGHLVVEAEGKASTGELWIRDAPRADFTCSATLTRTAGGLRLAFQPRDGAGRSIPAKVEWRVLRQALAEEAERASAEVVQEGQTESTGEGAQVEVQVPSAADARFLVEAAAVDRFGHRAPARAELVRLQGKVHVALRPERRIYAPGETATVQLRASDASGRPAAASVLVRSTVSRMGPAGEATRTAPRQVEVAIPASGRGEITLPALQPGYVEVEAEVEGLRVAEAVLYVSARGGDIPFTPDALTLVPDKARYAPGETARVLLFAPFESGSALVTVDSGDLTHSEVLTIHGSSALLSHRLLAGMPAVVSAVAVLDGQSFAASRPLLLAGATEPGSLGVLLEPGPRPGTLALTVRARDASDHPVAGAEVLASVRTSDALAPLAPPLSELLSPPPALEAKTDVSLDFQSAGQSRVPSARLLPVGPAAFSPLKGVAAAPPRAPHAILEDLQRLPPTDRAGQSRLVLPCGDAHEVTVEVTAALPVADPRAAPALLQASARHEVPGVAAVPELPRQLRPGDHVLGRVELLGAAGATTATVNGRALALGAGRPNLATLTLDSQHPSYAIEAAGRRPLAGRVAIDSGEEWVTFLAGEAQGTVRLATEDEASTVRVRAVAGPAGLLQLLAHPPHGEVRPADFEGLGPGALPPTHDERLALLAAALAAHELSPDAPALAAAAAGVVGALEPSGELAVFRGGPGDATRSALALWLLARAQQAGAGVPPEWLERMRLRLEALRPGTALAALALGRPSSLPSASTVEAMAAQVLAAEQLRAAEVAELAGQIERSAGVSGGLACWGAAECEPRAPASVETLTATAWAIQALARARPRSPRLPAALRYLMTTRDQAVWGRGLSGALIPLALGEARKVLRDKAAVLRLSAGGSASEVKLVPGGSAVLFGSGGPVTLRVRGGPVFFEVARARAEPREARGELTVERRYFTIDPASPKAERVPVADHLPQGALVQVELTVTGAPPGSALLLEDRLPAALEPITQGGSADPAALFEEHGGAFTFGAGAARMEAIAGPTPLTVSYLARARLAGRSLAPAAQATTDALDGSSGIAELTVEGKP